jgi:septum formation protein
VRLVLASASPRRAELLRAAGIAFETLVVEIDETVRPGEDPAAYVRRLAMEKSARAQTILAGPAKAGPHVPGPAAETGLRVPGASPGSSYVGSGFSRTSGEEELFVLAADTTVVVDGDILGKPRDDRDAERMLRRLSGRRHEVLTGVSLRWNEVERGRVETTAVELAPLGDADLARYVASGEGQDKAGAYAIQGLASRFITRIDGSYSNVVGLPVHTVFTLLQEWRETGYSL